MNKFIDRIMYKLGYVKEQELIKVTKNNKTLRDALHCIKIAVSEQSQYGGRKIGYSYLDTMSRIDLICNRSYLI